MKHVQHRYIALALALAFGIALCVCLPAHANARLIANLSSTGGGSSGISPWVAFPGKENPAPPSTSPASTQPSAAETQVLTPTQIDSNTALFNPTSGLYTLVTQVLPNINFLPITAKNNDAVPTQILGGAPVNTYGRMSWHSLEPLQGQYDFSIIDNVLATLPKGGRFGFRIMAFDPQVKLDTNVTTGTDGYPIYSESPGYLLTDNHGWLLPVNPTDPTQGHYFIPDWNDPIFLERLQALLAVLGARYDGDPRIGPIDIGLYGSWGEWHTGGLPDTTDYPGGGIPYTNSSPYFNLNQQAYFQNNGVAGNYGTGTSASKNYIIDAHVNAFSHSQLIMLTDDGEGLCYALGHSNTYYPIGMRRDSLGSGTQSFTYQFPDQLPGCNSQADQDLINNRWKTAPFDVEAFGNGSSPSFPCETFETDPGTGAYYFTEEISQYHIAGVKNASFCSGTWPMLSAAEQQAVISGGLEAGYRLAPTTVTIPVSDDGKSLTVVAQWSNQGATPTYDLWNVEYSLWTQGDNKEMASFFSALDLRQVLPTGNKPFFFQDDFHLSDIAPSVYILKVRVIDPNNYLNPMQLAITQGTADGYYTLGAVAIP